MYDIRYYNCIIFELSSIRVGPEEVSLVGVATAKKKLFQILQIERASERHEQRLWNEYTY